VKPSSLIDKSTLSGATANTGNMGIALRIALTSWLLALITLFLFVLLTIPQQKKMFFKNLESKANSVAVSLHDVAAGATINEDYASVVSAGQTMLGGDPDLDFLIVMKNDGFSLAIQKNGWKTDIQSGDYWIPKQRKPVSRITTVPLFNRRVFHYAQPFDYSGIEWGWIHVGLSLEGFINILQKSLWIAVLSSTIRIR